MNKWPRCEDCVRDNYLRAPVCPGDESAAGSLSRYSSGLAEV